MTGAPLPPPHTAPLYSRVMSRKSIVDSTNRIAGAGASTTYISQSCAAPAAAAPSCPCRLRPSVAVGWGSTINSTKTRERVCACASLVSSFSHQNQREPCGHIPRGRLPPRATGSASGGGTNGGIPPIAKVLENMSSPHNLIPSSLCPLRAQHGFRNGGNPPICPLSLRRPGSLPGSSLHPDPASQPFDLSNRARGCSAQLSRSTSAHAYS